MPYDQLVQRGGVASGGGPLPHGDTIQQAFGRHDVSGVRAHTGSAAASATASMGAEAYATGNDVAFGSTSPSLHTAAHEAAHVVQQRGGVQLKGGVGQVGDAYEQHADAVADHVVQGKNAEALLDQYAGAGGSAGAVQHKALQFEIKADLRKAMSGWGSDDNAVIARLQAATAVELQQVVADAGMMHQLQSELSRANMERVLDMLQAVFGQALLSEAVRLSEAGLDPVLLECAKLLVFRRNLAQTAAHGPAELVFEGVADGDRLQFGVVELASGTRRDTVTAPRDVLDEVAATRDELAGRYPALFARPYLSATRYLFGAAA